MMLSLEIIFREFLLQLQRSPALLPDVPGAGITLAEKPLWATVARLAFLAEPVSSPQLLCAVVPWCGAESPVT